MEIESPGLATSQNADIHCTLAQRSYLPLLKERKTALESECACGERDKPVWLSWDNYNLPLSVWGCGGRRGAGLWLGEWVRGGVGKRWASPDLFLNIYPFGCCQLRFTDELRLVMDNCLSPEWVYLSAVFRGHESARLSLVGRPWVSPQVFCPQEDSGPGRAGGQNLYLGFQGNCWFNPKCRHFGIPPKTCCFANDGNKFWERSCPRFLAFLCICHDTEVMDDLPVESPVKMLPVTQAGLTSSQHVYSWCWIKIKGRDPGSLSVPLVRPLRCREAGCCVRRRWGHQRYPAGPP